MREYDIDAMLENSEYVTGILEVVHALQKTDSYTKQDAVNDLMELLERKESTIFIYKGK